MVSLLKKNAAIFLIFIEMSACSSLQGDWPSLAEPVPDASERVRVIESVRPSRRETETDESVLTRSTAFKLFESTKAHLMQAKKHYEAISASLHSALRAPSGESALDIWNEAQLALTRYSHLVSRLDQILENTDLQNAPIHQTVMAFKQEQDAFLVKERASLDALSPR